MDKHNNINGIADNPSELYILDRKPLVTYAGDKELFLSLESTLSSSLPQEATEWRRSYGRAIKSIHVSASFVPFTKDVLPKEGNFHLIEQPMLHTYWTQCSDVETYKTSIRDDIELWMRVLIQYNLTDWMIVLVETYDFRKTNKLIPRTTVLDKIRSDFGAKHADRCLSVINPLRSESRSAGSWRGLIVNFRLLLLTAYDKTLLRFEEIIREQRERRNHAGWSFTKYFLLQEELAFVLEMLGVYEEALVQYDELDALFTQFVLNSHLGESPVWLSQFSLPLETWAGLTLSAKINTKERARIKNNSMSLLQFRNYLFSRQCAMLLYAKKPWEVAERTLPFLHNCIRELSLLDVVSVQGVVSCWVFLSCLEVLQTCKTYTETSHVEQYSLYTAGLWAYARQKLAELGELCGLMPGNTPSSEQIHRVVELSSGLDGSSAGPVEKLKNALSCQNAFCKQYLELSELAMGTYKHIGRVRSARAIGHDLANFYKKTGDYATATSFLQNALHCYEQDAWKQLASTTRLELAECYLQLGDLHRYVKMCTSIASSPELGMETRMKYYEEMLKVLENSKSEPPWTGLLSDCLTLTEIDLQVDKGNTTVTGILSIQSNLPVATHCSNISVSVTLVKHHDKQNLKHRDSFSNRRKSKEDLVPINPLLQRLHVISRLEYQQDKSLAGASLDIKNQKSLLRRQDSHGKYRKVSTVSKSDFTKCLSASDIVLQPGNNIVSLVAQGQEPGTYKLGQFSVLLLGKLDLLSTAMPHKLHYEISQKLPTVAVNTVEGELVAGVHQTLSVELNTGGFRLQNGSVLRLRTTHGLTIQLKESNEPLGRSLEIVLPESEPNTTMKMPVSMFAHLPAQKDSSSIEHIVYMKAPWAEEENPITLPMQPALTSTFKLHTARLRKFIRVTVCGHTQQKLFLSKPTMAVVNPSGACLVSTNPSDMSVVISSEKKVGYMWRLDTEPMADEVPVKIEFTLNYTPADAESSAPPLVYKYTFDLKNYQTTYLVESKVEPVRGCEFCRISTVCQLVVKVSRVRNTCDTSLMYEVLAENNMWAICGRTAGVLSLEDTETKSVTLDVMPLINGYLPLPMIRLSKYIPANTKNTLSNPHNDSHSRLEKFKQGEVYYVSKGTQVHVIAAVSPQDT